MWNRDELRDWQDGDPEISTVKGCLAWYNKRPPWEAVAMHTTSANAYFTQLDNLKLQDEILYRTKCFENRGKLSAKQLVSPPRLRTDILYWPEYKNDIAHWCEKCNA